MALAIGMVSRMYIPMMRRGEGTLICLGSAHESTGGHDLSMTSSNKHHVKTGVNISLELPERTTRMWARDLEDKLRTAFRVSMALSTP